MEKKLKYEELLFPEKRPNCPRCGSTHVISRGIEWGCAECGRRWIKKKNWGKHYKKEERRRTNEKEKMDRETIERED